MNQWVPVIEVMASFKEQLLADVQYRYGPIQDMLILSMLVLGDEGCCLIYNFNKINAKYMYMYIHMQILFIFILYYYYMYMQVSIISFLLDQQILSMYISNIAVYMYLHDCTCRCVYMQMIYNYK